MVFLEAFGFKGECPLCLSFNSVKFTSSLGFGSGSMEVLIALVPELDGIVDSDGDHSSTPSVGMLFVGCV